MRDIPARAAPGNSPTRGIGCRFFIFQFALHLRPGRRGALPVRFGTFKKKLDYELELAAVIGREGSNIAEADALSYIAGFTIFNDWSCRDLQRDEMAARLGPAKGKDSASSRGPWIVTTDELAPFIRDGWLHARCSLKVNGATWMNNDAGLMYHTWGAMIERASRDGRIVPATSSAAVRSPVDRRRGDTQRLPCPLSSTR